jgi:Tol biopolymer transport system component
MSNIWVAPKGETRVAAMVSPSSTTFDGTYGLTWTPDGQLLYSSAANGTFDLWMMKPDGSGRRPFATDSGASLFPDVSRDGQFVVLTSDRGSNNFQIWRIGIDGTGITPLTRDDTAWGPRTLPDGSVILPSFWRVNPAVWHAGFRIIAATASIGGR